MGYNRKMTPSQKITALRESRKYTQEALADALKCSKAKISRVESGECEYSESDIKLAKTFFDVEDAPFTGRERMDFKQRLYKWKHWTKNGHIKEARQYQKSVSVITKLPFESELSMLYRMFEIRLVLKECKPDLAEEMLRLEEDNVEDVSEEGQHHFYYNLGSVYLYRFDFKSAMESYLKSLDLEVYVLEKDIGLHLNLSMCYGELGKYVLAISTIEKAYHKFDNNNIGLIRGYIDNILAINYVRIGQITRAKRLLDRSLSQTMGNTNTFFTHSALHNYGLACFEAKEYEEAVKYFDRVLEGYKTIDNWYLETMYCKIRCLIADKKVSKAKPILSRAMSLAEDNAHYSFAFESLSHLITIKQDESIEFIEQKTIPYFVGKHENYKALDYCTLLENIFKKRGKGYKIRALEITSIICDITKEITFGEEV